MLTFIRASSLLDNLDQGERKLSSATSQQHKTENNKLTESYGERQWPCQCNLPTVKRQRTGNVKWGFSLPDVVEGQAVSKKRKLAKDSETTERKSHSLEHLTLTCGKSNCEFTAHSFQDLEDNMLLDVNNNKLNTYDKVTLKWAKVLETVWAGLKTAREQAVITAVQRPQPPMGWALRKLSRTGIKPVNIQMKFWII